MPWTGLGSYLSHTIAFEMNNVLDMAEALALQVDVDESLAVWSATETATGRRLTKLGMQLEKALIWNIPDFASMDEAGMREWWTNAAKMPKDMFASDEDTDEDKE